MREIEDLDNVHKYILWNKEIRINVKNVFYKHYLDKNIKYTSDLLHDRTNIESFNVVKYAGLARSNFLEWTGLRHSVPLELLVNAPNPEDTLDLETLKCHD